MKRFIAALLTVAMAVSFAPFSVFAGGSGTKSLPETSAESTAAQQEEIARALQSTYDPFGRNYVSAQTEENQSQQAEVDTSDVSLTATNSFGQLLVNSMDEQNGTNGEYTSRVTSLKMNGHTATVEFVTDKAADLVVAVYTDSDAEEMVASGTAEVSGSGGNDSVSVAIQGEIPEYYTVKAFLLNKNTHEPLSQVYTDSSRTKVMVDLSTAKASDFPEDRVINLDGQDDTNFAVVSDETTLVTYENNAAGKNQVISEDDDALVYVIGNASDEIKNLQSNDILTYEYEPGKLLIARVENIAVDGDTVTIYGDDTLELTDVFDALKIEESAGSGEFVHSDEGMDPAVEYLGVYDSPIDQTNKFHIEDGGITDTIPIVDASVHDFKLNGSVKDEKNGAFSVKISGTLSMNVNVDFAYFIAMNRLYVALSNDVNISGSVSLSGAVTGKIPLGPFHTPEALKDLGIEAEITPNFVVEVSAKFALKYSYSQYVEFYYASSTGFENRSTPGVSSIMPIKEAEATESIEIQAFVGVEIGPKIDVLDKLNMECKLKGGGQVTLQTLTPGQGIKHECESCFDIDVSVVGKLTLQLVFLKRDLTKGEIPKELNFLDYTVGDFYWSLTYDEFGAGDCPHLAYKINVKLDGVSQQGITIYEKVYNDDTVSGTLSKLGNTGADGTLEVYLKPGWYLLVAKVMEDGEIREYSGEVTVKKQAGTVLLKKEGDTPDPDPDPDTPNPDPPVYDVWTLTNGVLTIEKMGVYGQKEDAPWNDYRDQIREVVFAGDLLTIIGKYAFEDCMNLTKVTFNYHIAGFYDNAFKGCTSITDVYCLGDNMNQWLRLDAGKGNECITSARIHCQDGTILGYGKCGNDLNWLLSDDGILRITGTGSMAANPEWPKDQIVNVVIGKGVTSISAGAFKGCENLTNVTLPDGLTSIGPAAFQGCKSLTSVTLPEGMKSIETVAFSGCSGMTEIVIPSSVKSIGQQALANCSSLTNVVLPEGLISIADGAFAECRSLTSITIPESVTTIGEDAFTECSGLTSVTLPKNLTRLEPFTFSGCSNLSNVIIPESITRIEEYVFQKCSNLTDIEIPESVTAIESKAFYMCSSLASVKLPQKLTSIGEMAFGYCSSLTNIVIPESVTKIDNGAFHKCSSLANIIIPEGIVGIEIATFDSCSSLASVTIPVSVGYIRASAFDGCDNLEAVYYGGTKNQWNEVGKYSFNDPLYSATIHCTDGDILHEDTSCENSVTTGSAAADNGTFSAAFDNVSAGKDYAVIISRAETDPLNPDNLIYINQITAVADGELSVPFHTGASADEMVYVVACARDDITIDPVQPIDPVNPDAPSGDGDGAGAAIAIVGGVVAVAAVAGVVLMVPVEVSGTVKCTNQAVLPAAVQVLQGDKVIAETVTDAEGRFTVKVRRGSYTLRVRYVGADGYPVTRTVDFKAPNKNLNVAA